MNKMLRKHAKTIVFFDFSNQAGAQVPIFTVQKSFFGHLPRIPRKWSTNWGSQSTNNAPGSG